MFFHEAEKWMQIFRRILFKQRTVGIYVLQTRTTDLSQESVYLENFTILFYDSVTTDHDRLQFRLSDALTTSHFFFLFSAQSAVRSEITYGTMNDDNSMVGRRDE